MKKHFFILFFLTFEVVVAQKNNDYVMAENYFMNNEYEKALQLYKKISEKSPYNNNILGRLITCYQAIDSFKTVDKLLLKKITQKPRLTYINVYLGYNQERQQQSKNAEKYYQKALKSIEKSAAYGGAIANIFKEYGKLNLAIQAYNKATAKNKNANYGFQIAQIYGEQGKFAQMFEEYINFVDKDKRYVATVKRYVAKYVTNDSESENNILFKKALLRRSASNPKDEWNNLLSWLFTKQKEYGKALIQQKALYTRKPNNLDKIEEIGEIAFKNKDYSNAKKCFDFIIEKTEYTEAKFNAIYYNLQIAIKTKQPDIEEQFQQIFTKNGINSNTFPIQMAYANYLTFEKNNPEQAKEVLEKALPYAKNKYQKALVKIQLADVLVYQSRFNKALIYFSQVQTQFKNHYLAHEARFKVAQTSYFKNDFKWAKAQLKILKGSTTQLIANDAADLFLTISDNQPKDSISTGLAEYAQADLLAYQNKNNEAITILNDIIINFKGQPIEDEALFKQAVIFEKKTQFKNAVTNYKNIIALNKEGVLVDDSLYKLAEIYNHKLNDIEQAKTYYQKIIFDYPSSIYLVDARNKYRILRGDKLN